MRPKILNRPLAKRTIGIIFTPRSGSSWLTEVLTKDGRFGKPQEWFNPNFVPDISRRIGAKDPKDYVDLLQRQHQSGNVFSFEATLYQIDRVFKRRADFLDAFANTPIDWYYLTRKDIVLQAVSLAKAVDTGVFHAPAQSVEDRLLADQSFDYDPREVSKWLDHIAKLEHRSEDFFSANGIAPIRLVYEDVVSEDVSTVLDLFAAKSGAGTKAQSNQSNRANRANRAKRAKRANGQNKDQPFDTQHKKIGSSKNLDFATRFRTENQEAVARIEARRNSLAAPGIGSAVDPTLYIHIGAHKTGTTALQYRAKTGAAQLAKHGILYPDSNIYHHGHHRLAFALKGQVDPARGDVPDLATELKHLREAVRQAGLPKALISSEGLMVLSKKRIAKLAKALNEFDLHVLAMVRRPDDYLLSHYNQLAKAAGNAFTLSQHAFFSNSDHFPKELDFGRWIGNWARVVGRDAVTLLTYEAGDPTETVLSQIGVPGNVLPPAKHLNRSLSTWELSVMRAVKRAGLSVPVQKKAMEYSSKLFSGTDQPELSDADRAAILEHCAADMQALFDRFDQENPYVPLDPAQQTPTRP